jgi:sugar-specific transcriptional regulator TrmB
MSLERFGSTRTQDTVYKALLRHDAATGYAIARDTGLARANVYQALDALVSRGLAQSSGGRPATYRAAEPADAIALLAKRAEQDLAALAVELGAPTASRAKTRPARAAAVECFEGPAALFAAAAAAADAATQEVLAVVGPWAPVVAEALARARLRGVSWKVVSLGAPAPEGAALRAVPSADLTAYWGGMPVALVCDRTVAVCGIVAGERAEGIRTASHGLVPFLRHLLRRELATAASPRIS